MLVIFLWVLVLGTVLSQTGHAATAAVSAPELARAYSRLPLSFEANQGQTDSRVRFVSRGAGSTVYLTESEAVLALRGSLLRIQYRGAAPVTVSGVDALPGRANYFIGRDPARWQQNIPLYGQVLYAGVYPGIDLVYHGRRGQLEYDFIVKPGARPESVVLGIQGAERLRLDQRGDLLLDLVDGQVRMERPRIYQDIDGTRRAVAGGFVLSGPREIRFHVGAYDDNVPLVIDPTVFYSTYLGGSGEDVAYSVAVDSAGNAVLTGYTDSLNFPVTSGALKTTPGGGRDAFITKLNPTGSGVFFSTYLGGGSNEEARGAAVDAAGNSIVAGFTGSADFPTTSGAYKTVLFPAEQNGFVTKLDPNGALIYSTYLGGTFLDIIFAVAADAAGNAYVAGKASSPDYPTTPGAYQPAMLGGGGTAFATKLDPSGTQVLYSTFLGGVDVSSIAFGIAVDTSGQACVTGTLTCGNCTANGYPTTAGAFQTSYGGGGNDAFVTKLNATGTAPVYSTYLGGSALENVHGIAVDMAGSAYVIGVTNSTDYPVSAGAFQTTFGGVGDAFVTKLNATGSGLAYSSFLGSSDNDDGRSIAVDSAGNAYVTGGTGSTNFPVTPGTTQPTFGGGSDAFVTVFNPTGSGLVYSSFLGGNDVEEGLGIALDSFSNAYIVGQTGSSNFPVGTGVFQSTYGGGTLDGFVTKIINIVVEAQPQAGKVTGGGTITVPGGTGNFGFIVQRDQVGAPVGGQVTYNDKASGVKIRSTDLTAFTISGTSATFGGSCTNNGAPCTFSATVEDNGEPGFNDTFTISISGGSPAGGTLRSGNVQIH